MKKIIIFLLVFLPVFIAQAQKGSIQIVGDKKVSDLVDTHIKFNERVKTIPGFRILIASTSGTNSKSAAFSIKERFLSEFPEMTSYIVFDEPNFKVKVGDFITKLDAFVFLQKIKNQYSCTIIKDNVYPIRLTTDDFIQESENEEP